ncbi:MAG: FAD-dependent oxidoreductase, partial [Pseudomonadota bacterium]
MPKPVLTTGDWPSDPALIAPALRRDAPAMHRPATWTRGLLDALHPAPSHAAPRGRVVVIGGGFGGLAAALRLAVAGQRVTLLERAPMIGGKARRIGVAGSAVDAGPTVFTMRWVFEELFATAGIQLDEAVTLRAARVLARHAWP